MKKGFQYLETVTKLLEIVIAVVLLIVVAVKIIENCAGFLGYSLMILPLEFDRVLSITLGLVIGVEFTKMLVKHTPDSVIEVLLFAIARQMVVYHDDTLDLLIGVAAIAGLFAVKRFLLGSHSGEKIDSSEK